MPTAQRKKPFGYRLLWIETALLSIVGWGRAYTAVANWARISELIDQFPIPIYVAIFAISGTIFGGITYGLWQRQWWAIRWLWPILVAYVGFILGWEWRFAQIPGTHERLPFWLGLTIIILFVNLWLINRRNMRQYFLSPSTG